jgi:hypothetical protein
MFHRAASTALFLTLVLTPVFAFATDTSPSPTAATAGCLATGDGYLRARIRGALTLDLDWKNAEMECDGGPRPRNKDNVSNGVRVSIGGPSRGDGRRIRLVFGVGGVSEGGGGEALRTNVTLLLEGEKRLFSTRGDDKCTVDTLDQQRVETLGDKTAVYRVVARGFCLGPASGIAPGERIVVTSFDFAGRIVFEEDDRHAPAT